MAGIAVNSLLPDDRQAWEALFRGYLEFYETRLEDVVIDTTFRRLLDPLMDMHALVARDGEGRPFGLVHYLFHPTNWAVGPCCYLQDLYVDPDRRGTGAGRALIQAVYAAADGRDASQVYWLTQDFNETARRLYDKVATLTPFIKYRR